MFYNFYTSACALACKDLQCFLSCDGKESLFSGCVQGRTCFYFKEAPVGIVNM